MLYAFADETGDRGTSQKSSLYFAMAAVVFPDEIHNQVKETVASLKDDFGIPHTTALHWTQHCRSFERRQRVATQLAALEPLRLTFVVFEKAAIPLKSAIISDGVKFYNYLAGITLERIVLTAADSKRAHNQISATFGHVRGVDPDETVNYLESKRAESNSFVPWKLLISRPRIVDAATNSGVQLADLYAGMLWAAINPDSFGGFEPHHLLKVQHQIRRSQSGRIWGYGFKAMARGDFRDKLTWWPDLGD